MVHWKSSHITYPLNRWPVCQLLLRVESERLSPIWDSHCTTLYSTQSALQQIPVWKISVHLRCLVISLRKNVGIRFLFHLSPTDDCLIKFFLLADFTDVPVSKFWRLWQYIRVGAVTPKPVFVCLLQLAITEELKKKVKGFACCMKKKIALFLNHVFWIVFTLRGVFVTEQSERHFRCRDVPSITSRNIG